LLGLKLGYRIRIPRRWRVLGFKWTSVRLLAIDLDCTYVHKALHTRSGRLARKILCAVKIYPSHCGEALRGISLRNLYLRGQVHYHVHLRYALKPVRGAIDLADYGIMVRRRHINAIRGTYNASDRIACASQGLT
jgi:hypothetical protein